MIFLRRGIEVLPEGFRDQHVGGLILAFTVNDLPGEHARLRAEGAPIAMELREEPWGERLFQVSDPNGVIIQLVDWVTTDASQAQPGDVNPVNPADSHQVIQVRGARENNLTDVSLDIPKRRLTVFTGVSGSGKSSSSSVPSPPSRSG